MNEKALRAELARFCRFAYHRGLVSAAGGNLSARLGDTDTFLITPSGVSLRDMAARDLVTIDLRGHKLAGPNSAVPSKEALMHTAAYAARPAVRAVAHLHPPHAVGWGVSGRPIPLVTVTARERLGPTPVVPPAPSGSRDLALGVAQVLGACDADVRLLLLGRHGVLAMGTSVRQAIDIADLAEYTAQIASVAARIEGWGATSAVDISVPDRPGMHVYPGDPPIEIARLRSIAAGGPCNVSRLTLGSHTGTHVDAPVHFVPDGPTLEQVPLDRMVGEALVADLRGKRAIDRAALEPLEIGRGDILLCRTDNSWRWDREGFQQDFTPLTLDGAELIIERGVKTVGIDYLSVEAFGSEDFAVHKRLLGRGIFIIEGLDLRPVQPGRHFLVCLPLLLPGLDGAPARAILLKRQEG